MTTYELLQESCINSANCVAIAPSLFAKGDDGFVAALKETVADEAEEESLEDAADSCPVRAIVLHQ